MHSAALPTRHLRTAYDPGLCKLVQATSPPPTSLGSAQGSITSMQLPKCHSKELWHCSNCSVPLTCLDILTLTWGLWASVFSMMTE